MRKILLAMAAVALSGGIAQAEDKGTEFKFGGEIRQQLNWTDNHNFRDDSTGNKKVTETIWHQRTRFNINAVSSENLQGYIGFEHQGFWGDDSPSNTAAVQPMVDLQDAWLWWKISDSFSLKSGRQRYRKGDGLVLGDNDAQLTATRLDGVVARYSTDFLDVDLSGFVTREGTASVGETDLQDNLYVAYLALKNLPEVLSAADLYLVQRNRTFGSTAGNSDSLTHIGLRAKGMFSIVDYRAEAGFQSGKEKHGGTSAADKDIGGTMFDLEAGVNFPEFMNARVHAGYHMDSGDDNATTANKDETYVNILGENRMVLGRSGLFDFGNITNIHFGLAVEPSETCKIGVEVSMLSRTKDGSNVTSSVMTRGRTAGTFLNIPTTSTDASKASLATEIDVYASHAYNDSFSMGLLVSSISLGDFYTTTTGNAVGSALLGQVTATYNF